MNASNRTDELFFAISLTDCVQVHDQTRVVKEKRTFLPHLPNVFFCFVIIFFILYFRSINLQLWFCESMCFSVCVCDLQYCWYVLILRLFGACVCIGKGVWDWDRLIKSTFTATSVTSGKGGSLGCGAASSHPPSPNPFPRASEIHWGGFHRARNMKNITQLFQLYFVFFIGSVSLFAAPPSSSHSPFTLSLLYFIIL